jgi:hypothetical protein
MDMFRSNLTTFKCFGDNRFTDIQRNKSGGRGLKVIKEPYKSETYPHIPKIPISKVTNHPEVIKMDTRHEGPIIYVRFWNFFVRHGVFAEPLATGNNMFYFFHNYESSTTEVLNLIKAVGAPASYPQSEVEVWNRISTVWSWLCNNVKYDATAYGAIILGGNRWPSIDELAQYYAQNNKLVWAACFSKAHLFAVLLGRVLPRWRLVILDAHHTENGAPPTSTHVYLGVYLTSRWYYLDPADVYMGPLPSFENRKSVGSLKTVDYEHPYSAIPVPNSPFDKVPYIPV